MIRRSFAPAALALLTLAATAAAASPAATQLDRLGTVWEEGRDRDAAATGSPAATDAQGRPVRAARPSARGRRSAAPEFPRTPWDHDASDHIDSKRAD